MGDIIPFRPRAKQHTSLQHESIDRPKRDRSSEHVDDYAAAQETINAIADQFHFHVMLDGLPRDGRMLLDISRRLHGSLLALEKEYGSSVFRSLRSIQVCLSRSESELSKKEGFRTLFLKNDFSAEDVAQLVRPLLLARNRSL